MLPVTSSLPPRFATARAAVSKPRVGIKAQLDEMTKGKHVMVFTGYSGLGYADIGALHESLESVLRQSIEKFGINNLIVVSGATTDGIGTVYSIAKKWGLKTLGVVSEQAREYGHISEDCDDVIYVPDPAASWKVLDENGNSYMTYLSSSKEDISRTGEILAFGGGDVTVSELEEAKKLESKFTAYGHFLPDPEKADLKKAQNPGVDLTPVLNFDNHS